MNSDRAQHGSLFWRLWLRSLTVKRPQAALAIASVLVGAAVASMLLNLYGDVRRKMTQEFRAYGPNVVVGPVASSVPNAAANAAAVSGSSPNVVAGTMDEAVMGALAPFAQRTNGFAAVPVLYAVTAVKKVLKSPDDSARIEPENVVAVGADFGALRRINPSWRLSGGGTGVSPVQEHGQDPESSGPSAHATEAIRSGTGVSPVQEHGQDAHATAQCVAGAHLASRLRLVPGDAIDLSGLSEKPQSYRVSAIVTTGAAEDDQVFVPLDMLQGQANLAGKISMVQLSVPGDTAEVERILAELSQAWRNSAGIEVRPIRQIVYSSGKVLETIRWVMLSLTGLILIIIALCVMATMTAIVLERRKDIAVMKSLGASDRLVMRLFLTEGATLGMVGGIAGFALGLGLAHEMAHRLFSVSLSPAGAGWWTFPAICLASITLAVVATLFPVEIVRGIQPARELRGE